MKRSTVNRLARTWHRRLGIVIGIQLMLWTLSGVYFSWLHIDNVHGDYEMAEQPEIEPPAIPDITALPGILERSALQRIDEVQVRMLLGRPAVLLTGGEDAELFDAADGTRLSPITEEQARQIADADFAPDAGITGVMLVTEKKGEYKGPVPVYRVSFGNWKNTNVYVHETTGRVMARRNSIWRGFDFLWMIHILDFAEREDINNWILRVMSLLGVVTLLSGYLLWVLTSPVFRRRRSQL